MIQILWKGRGGQGAFTACRLLGAAWVDKGGYALAFPSFGPERRGAAVFAYTKLSERPVTDRSEITKPDYIIDLINPPEDALALAQSLGLPTVNTILLGKVAREIGIEPIYLERAIDSIMPPKLRERNKHAITAYPR